LIGACKKFHLVNMPCFYGEGFLDKRAAEIGAKRPEVREGVLFSDALDMLKNVKHEGFMVRCSMTENVICKLKSPYYLTKKFFMRVSKKRLERVFENKNEVKKTIDEEYYPLLDYITSNYTKEQWNLLQEQERKFVIENFLKGDVK